MNPFKLFKLKNEVETALELAINEQGEIVDESALALWESSLEAKNGYLLDMACEVKNPSTITLVALKASITTTSLPSKS